MAFARLKPFGNDVDNWRIGQLSALMANIHRRKGASPYSPADFMPKVRKQQTAEEQIKILKMYWG